MRAAQIDLQCKESTLYDLRSQLSRAESDRDMARREKDRAQRKKDEMTKVAVGVGILGIALTIATAGAAAPLAAGATAACGISAADHAKREEAANRDIDMYNRKISDVQNEIATSRNRISGMESQIRNLQRETQELEQRCKDYQDEKECIHDAIAFLQECRCFWGKFSNALKLRTNKTELLHHLLEIAEKAEEKKKRDFLKRKGSQIMVMSFVNAWERLRDDIQSGSGYIFSIPFTCIQCKQKFTALPFAKNGQFTCAGCHRAICE